MAYILDSVKETLTQRSTTSSVTTIYVSWPSLCLPQEVVEQVDAWISMRFGRRRTSILDVSSVHKLWLYTHVVVEPDTVDRVVTLHFKEIV